jgi:hypothetical protein
MGALLDVLEARLEVGQSRNERTILTPNSTVSLLKLLTGVRLRIRSLGFVKLVTD